MCFISFDSENNIIHVGKQHKQIIWLNNAFILGKPLSRHGSKGVSIYSIMVGDLVTAFASRVRWSTNKIGPKARNSTTFKATTWVEIKAIFGLHFSSRTIVNMTFLPTECSFRPPYANVIANQCQNIPGHNVPGHNCPNFGNLGQNIPGRNCPSKKNQYAFKYIALINIHVYFKPLTC